MALSPADSFTTDGMNEASKAIILSNQSGWEKLDFSDYPDLTDKDLHQLLALIDAKNTIKTLNIDCCPKIIGHGLEPLRGSTVLEGIYLDKEADICTTTIIPILESILDSTNYLRRNLVKNIAFEILVDEYRGEPLVRDFFLKIKQLILNEGKCELCEEERQLDEQHICERACFSCFRCFCDKCAPWTDDDDIFTCQCNISYCRSCYRSRDESFGKDFVNCSECDSIQCSWCADNDVEANTVISCGHAGWTDGRPVCSQCACYECSKIHELINKGKRLAVKNKRKTTSYAKRWRS